VPRVPPPERLPEIATAATDVFGSVGYKRARTAEVAARAGLSTGGLFTYVDSKKALFHLACVAGFGSLDDIGKSLPLEAPPLDETLNLIARGLDAKLAFPELRKAERRKAPRDLRGEVSAITTDMYDAMSRNWPTLAVIERSASDVRGLEDVFYVGGRRDRLLLLERYLERRAAEGRLRDIVNTAITARWMLETVTWFAWHRREDRDSQLYDDDVTLAAISRLMCDALVRS
jgi:AcrR family transcriptional regulator